MMRRRLHLESNRFLDLDTNHRVAFHQEWIELLRIVHVCIEFV